MDGGTTIVYDFSELREDVQTFSQQNREQNETIITSLGDISAQNETIITSLGDITTQNETILTELGTIAEQQGDIMIQNMLLIGLLGIIIGICFVNIFKSR